MAIISGPRQCGKTTACLNLFPNQLYLNWDNIDHRSLILAGPAKIAETLDSQGQKNILFDEMHKYPDWKNYLKGFFDTYAGQRNYKIVVTGSARLDFYRKGADSLLGRYFPYRLHPLSVREIAAPEKSETLIRPPVEVSDEDFSVLCQHGAFPEPYLRRSRTFTTRWRNVRRKLLIQEELRDVSEVHGIRQIELLSDFLRSQVAGQLNFANLAVKIRASEDSIRRWVSMLESIYYCFLVRPWSENIPRSLLKTPKVYLWDWSDVLSEGALRENIVASHLLKAVHAWTDIGLGEFDLYYLRTKDGMEIDFLVTKDGIPWFLVEVKSSHAEPLSSRLAYFQKTTGALHAFQVVFDVPFTSHNAFEFTYPVKVSARSFLSQLI